MKVSNFNSYTQYSTLTTANLYGKGEPELRNWTTPEIEAITDCRQSEKNLIGQTAEEYCDQIDFF